MTSEVPDAFHRNLEEFCRLLASFQYDRAREITDKMLESRRGFRHHQFCSLLAQLAAAERQYLALAFMIPKGFFQKDNTCKHLYESARHELSKMCSFPAGDSSSLLASLSRQLFGFVGARARLMDLYEQAWVTAGQQQKAVDIDFGGMAKEVDHISTVFQEGLTDPSLEFLKRLLNWELMILSGYLGCLDRVEKGDFCGAMEQMTLASGCRREWGGLLQGTRDTRRLMPSLMAGLRFSVPRAGAGGVGRAGAGVADSKQQHQEPPLFAWLTRGLRDATLTKLSFYFERPLLEGVADREEHERNKRARLSTDLSARMVSFQRRTDAYNVCAVYDASDSQDPCFAGWPPAPHPPPPHPPPDVLPPTGLELFPAVFSSPEWPHPAEHWPSVVMLMSNLRSELDRPDHPVTHFHDQAKDLTFFLVRLDRRLTGVAMYLGAGAASRVRGDPAVYGFLREAAATLRCSSTFARLKPGAAT